MELLVFPIDLCADFNSNYRKATNGPHSNKMASTIFQFHRIEPRTTLVALSHICFHFAVCCCKFLFDSLPYLWRNASKPPHTWSTFFIKKKSLICAPSFDFLSSDFMIPTLVVFFFFFVGFLFIFCFRFFHFFFRSFLLHSIFITTIKPK